MQSRITASIDARVSHKVRAIILVALLGLHCAGAYSADNTVDSGPSMFSLNGFGTLGVVHSSEGDADFVSNFSQPNGAGYTHSWSAGVDSRLGLQLDTRFSEKLSAVVQVVAQHQYDNHYAPEIEWANLKYQVTPDFSVRVGRTVTGFFTVSDSGLVSYTTPWVRPPLEVYGLLPVNHKDGVDASYRLQIGQVNDTLRASYGRNIIDVPGGGETIGRRFFDITETLEYGAVIVRAGYATLHLDYDVPGLPELFDDFAQFGQAVSAIPGLQALGARALTIASQYGVNDIPYRVYTMGATYDSGHWLLMAEWAKNPETKSFAVETAWYVTGGYRVRAFTPYMTMARITSKPISASGLSTAGLPADLASAAAGLNGGLSAVLSGFAGSQKTLSAGVRWDFMRNTAFKLQYERVTTGPAAGLLINVQPGFQPGSSFNVVSATIDFVF